MKKCCFIIPYFGKVPASFPIFLKTCGYNKEFNWLLITDDHTEFHYPSNFQVHYTSYTEIKALVNKKMGFEVAMEKPYKLCDLKPAYGYIFEEYLEDYLFWGHCDIDTIIGDLSAFITDDLLNSYDKLFCLGHMTLYRNTKENNRVFMSDFQGKSLFQEVYTNPASCWFDEEWHDENNINQIFLAQGKQVLIQDWSVNFDVSKRAFERVRYVGKLPEANAHGYYMYGAENAMYLWDSGKIERITVENGSLIRKPVMYMHFQHRKMKIEQSILNADRFSIVSNGFIAVGNKPMTVFRFYLRRRRTMCFDFYQKQMKIFLKRISNKVNKTLKK